jgi:2-(1,2-epoxy-1,2-dihydrophenyl)acetyl-CoA isomerase
MSDGPHDCEAPGLLVTELDGVWTLQFNRPRARNAFDWPVRHLLIDALTAATSDPNARLVVLRGDEAAFSAGGDVSEMSQGEPDTADKLAAGARIIELIADMPVPVIAAVQGHAAGAGFSIALACDLIYAADNAKFSPSFALIGLSTDLSASYWIPRALGIHRAKDLLIGGVPLNAEEARALGIVSAVWPLGDFEAALAERVATLAHGPTLAYRAIKRLVNGSLQRTLREHTLAEIEEQLRLVESHDHGEGLTAFSKRRPPQFLGR